MDDGSLEISIAELEDGANIPYELLLLADPSRDAIDTYLENSRVFRAFQNVTPIGVIVLHALSSESVEIKNIAVLDKFQGKGVGKQLLDFVIEWTKKAGFKTISIGTANSSIGQLYLYQMKGFEITGIIKNFFTDHYPEPIFEKGIQAKHMIILQRNL